MFDYKIGIIPWCLELNHVIEKCFLVDNRLMGVF